MKPKPNLDNPGPLKYQPRVSTKQSQAFRWGRATEMGKGHKIRIRGLLKISAACFCVLSYPKCSSYTKYLFMNIQGVSFIASNTLALWNGKLASSRHLPYSGKTLDIRGRRVMNLFQRSRDLRHERIKIQRLRRNKEKASTVKNTRSLHV